MVTVRRTVVATHTLLLKRQVSSTSKASLHLNQVPPCPGNHHLKVLEIGKTTMIVSVPRELSSDHSAVLLLAEASGRITEADISEKLQWEGGRPRRVLDELMQVFENCSLLCVQYSRTIAACEFG